MSNSANNPRLGDGECSGRDPIHEAFRNAEVFPSNYGSADQAGASVNERSLQGSQSAPSSISATLFKWCNPSDIPARAWVYGRHLIRRNVSLTVAPGGVGKSSLTIVQALELATGRGFLGQSIPGPVRVWLFNLEDERTELIRRLTAAMKHYGISEADLGGRLFYDTGREQELILAEQHREEVKFNDRLIEPLRDELLYKNIDVLIVDPFVSSHRVNEMDNGKIDMVVKRWVKLAEECGCAIELVHHTRKLNGAEASSDFSRGASSLVNAARSSRVLQRLSDDKLKEYRVFGDGNTYFSVMRDKANLASQGTEETYRTVSVDLGQGDHVGVVELWKRPRLFDGIGVDDLRRVQKALDGKKLRYSDQAKKDWAGLTIAKVLSLDPKNDRSRIKRLIEAWLESGALVKVEVKLGKGVARPILEVGEWA